MVSMATLFPQALSSALNATTDLQITTAEEAVTFVGKYVPLTISWSSKLSEDANIVYADSIGAASGVSGDREKLAVDSAEYSLDSTQMSIDTGSLSNLIQSDKLAASSQTQHMKEEYQTIPELESATLQVSSLLAQKY